MLENLRMFLGDASIASFESFSCCVILGYVIGGFYCYYLWSNDIKNINGFDNIKESKSGYSKNADVVPFSNGNNPVLELNNEFGYWILNEFDDMGMVDNVDIAVKDSFLSIYLLVFFIFILMRYFIKK